MGEAYGFGGCILDCLSAALSRVLIQIGGKAACEL